MSSGQDLGPHGCPPLRPIGLRSSEPRARAPMLCARPGARAGHAWRARVAAASGHEAGSLPVTQRSVPLQSCLRAGHLPGVG
eukprot:9520150-Lingulodinium_polyedra.AAC.1